MFDVLSFDDDRVTVKFSGDGKMIVEKITTEKENENIISARRHVVKYQPTLNSTVYGLVRIIVAEVMTWNRESNILATLFCLGKNLETLMKETVGSDRSDLIYLLRELLEVFKLSGFMWGDLAPRNMIWDQDAGIIWLVDFERELQLEGHPVEEHVFNRYIRNYSWEEFSCFLTRQENEILFSEFLNENATGYIPTHLIASKRKKALLRLMIGEKELYSLSEVRQVEDVMSDVATPFLVDNSFFFPMNSLDTIGSKGGSDEYARVVKSVYGMDEFERFSQLRRIAETF